MAITTFPKFRIPPTNSAGAGAWSLGTAGPMNASGDRVAFVIQCPKAGTLDKFEFRVGLVGNNPDNGLRLSFQTIDLTNGNPDGTPDQFRDITGTITSNTWQVPGLMTSDGTDTGTKRTVAAGELLGCVIDFVSFVASDSVGISYLAGGGSVVRNQYIDDGGSGSYVKNSADFPILALKYSDGSYAEFDLATWPVLTVEAVATGDGSTPDERALKVTLPADMRTVGAWILADVDGACEVVLYNAASGVIDAIALDPDQRSTTSGNYFFVTWPAGPHTLSAATVYRVAVKPTSATTLTLQTLQLPGAGYQQCIPGGSDFLSSTRTDAGVWSDDSTRRPMIGLIFDGVDLGTDPPPAVTRAYPFAG